MSLTAEPAAPGNPDRQAAPLPIRRRPRLILVSLVLAAPGWISWTVTHHGLTSATITSIVLAANVVVTSRFPTLKLPLVRTVQRYLINPLVRVLLSIRVLPLGIALLETTGRRTGRPRRTPVGEGLDGHIFWIVAEHGRRANYVQNIAANPKVRIRVRTGVWPKWLSGTATILDNDDPHARQRQLCRRHPLRTINAAFVRAWGTDLVTIRIDLTSASDR